jgi:hypothetical protein
MDLNLGYLLTLLEDEFLSREGVRIVPTFPSTLSRSPDLEQDYDPESNNLHTRKGVRVQALGREYFFPLTWVTENNQKEILEQIEEIRSRLRD